MKQYTFTVTEAERNQRLDQFLAHVLPEYSRSFMQKRIASDDVVINHRSSKPNYRLQVGDTVQITIQEIALEPSLEAENIPLDIIFENDDVIVLNKQPGIVVHPAAGHLQGTLINALIHHFPQIREAVHDQTHHISVTRPGLVHRLDRDTSGIMMVAKNARSLHSLSKQIQNRTVGKIYWAITYNWPKEEQGKLVDYLGRSESDRKKVTTVEPEKGREAISDYRVLRYYQCGNQRISLIEFTIRTGRTHQIRVQSSKMGCPILGDVTYGNKPSIALSDKWGIDRQLLHAYKLSFYLPGATERSSFTAELPNDFSHTLDKLEPCTIDLEMDPNP